MSGKTIKDLNDEEMLEIFQLLDPNSLKSCCLTCKRYERGKIADMQPENLNLFVFMEFCHCPVINLILDGTN